jgi:hypothetical protein
MTVDNPRHQKTVDGNWLIYSFSTNENYQEQVI